jgi:polyisoprenoid-binding protein YceI
MSFVSTAVRPKGEGYVVEGELSLHGVTRPVTLDLEPQGFGPDPFGGTRAGFSATTEINRKDFGIAFNMPLEGGGVVVGDKIQITLEIEAVLQRPAS